MDSARHVIKRIVDPRSLNSIEAYDVAQTIHQSLPGTKAAGGRCHLLHQMRLDTQGQINDSFKSSGTSQLIERGLGSMVDDAAGVGAKGSRLNDYLHIIISAAADRV